jgi:membrane protein YdbS with pleckstrin-like domain
MEKKPNNQKIKKLTILSLIITISMFLIFSFIKWDLLWIVNINEWNQSDRSAFVFVLFLCQLPSLFITFITHE